MKTLVILTLVQLFAAISNAYILPLEIILQKNAVVAGNSIISVDQDVVFKDAYRTVTVKENWLIEGDRNLKLSARGVGELRDLLSVGAVYNNKIKTVITAKSKQPRPPGEEFFERYLAIKSKDSFMGYLKDLGISQNVRLSRAAGAVCFAIGDPAKGAVPDNNPEIWIDQDSFRLVKIRFPSNAQIEFTDWAVYNKVHYPRKKTITWGDRSVVINVTKVSTKTGASIKSFYPENLEQPTEISLAKLGSLGSTIEEFYTRFR